MYKSHAASHETLHLGYIKQEMTDILREETFRQASQSFLVSLSAESVKFLRENVSISKIPLSVWSHEEDIINANLQQGNNGLVVYHVVLFKFAPSETYNLEAMNKARSGDVDGVGNDRTPLNAVSLTFGSNIFDKWKLIRNANIFHTFVHYANDDQDNTKNVNAYIGAFITSSDCLKQREGMVLAHDAKELAKKRNSSGGGSSGFLNGPLKALNNLIGGVFSNPFASTHLTTVATAAAAAVATSNAMSSNNPDAVNGTLAAYYNTIQYIDTSPDLNNEGERSRAERLAEYSKYREAPSRRDDMRDPRAKRRKLNVNKMDTDSNGDDTDEELMDHEFVE